MPLTFGDIGVIPSLHRFVDTNRLLGHWVVLPILISFTLGASIIAYFLPIHWGHSTVFSPSDTPVGWQHSGSTRGTLDIINSCISTLVTCVYTAVHFNLPHSEAHRLSPWKKVRSKDFWLEFWVQVSFWLLGLFSPEMLVLHALYEYMIVRYDVAWMRKHGHPKWSQTLAFFADMDGFRLVIEDGRQEQVRSGFALAEMFEQSGEPWSLDCTALEYEIADKTKANMLLKIITTLQIIRFFVGVVARSMKRLPIAPLENITCAYVICTLVYYGLWFNKPYNVKERILVRKSPPRLHRSTNMRNPKPKRKHKTIMKPMHAFWKLLLQPEMTEGKQRRGSKYLGQDSPCKSL